MPLWVGAGFGGELNLEKGEARPGFRKEEDEDDEEGEEEREGNEEGKEVVRQRSLGDTVETGDLAPADPSVLRGALMMGAIGEIAGPTVGL